MLSTQQSSRAIVCDTNDRLIESKGKGNAMMTTITRWVLAHKRIVATFWILVTVIGFATVSQATKAFSNEFSVPGREGFQTNLVIQHLYHQGGGKAPIVPVVTLPAGTSVSSP